MVRPTLLGGCYLLRRVFDGTKDPISLSGAALGSTFYQGKFRNLESSLNRSSIGDIDYYKLILRHIDDDILEGIILDFMFASGSPTLDFLLDFKSKFPCPPSNLAKFDDALRSISVKLGFKTVFEKKTNPEWETAGKIDTEEVIDLSVHFAKDIISSADLRIMQISDIHMGLLHSSKGRPGSKPHNSLVLALKNMPEEYKPHLCVISGDLTSISDIKEFKEAVEFLDKLATEDVMGTVDGLPPKSRILIVPGNHDNKWNKEELSTDKLAEFYAQVVDHGGFITPFGVPDLISSGANIDNYDNSSDRLTSELPPFATVCYPSLKLCINLFTTCYYSGEGFKDERMEKLQTVHAALLGKKTNEEAVKCLREILELDNGYVTDEYLDSVNDVVRKASKTYPVKDNIWFGVMHHPIVNVAKAKACYESNALRTKLKQYLCTPLVMHGHAHAVNRRPDTPNPSRATGVACPSLSALDSEDMLGVVFHCFNKESHRLKCISWSIDPEGVFLFTDEYLNTFDDSYEV